MASVSRRASLLIGLAPSRVAHAPLFEIALPLNPKPRGISRNRCMQSLGGWGGADKDKRVREKCPNKETHHSCSFLLPRRCGFSGESTRLSAVRLRS